MYDYEEEGYDDDFDGLGLVLTALFFVVFVSVIVAGIIKLTQWRS
jgi:hypothetical protein